MFVKATAERARMQHRMNRGTTFIRLSAAPRGNIGLPQGDPASATQDFEPEALDSRAGIVSVQTTRQIVAVVDDLPSIGRVCRLWQ